MSARASKDLIYFISGMWCSTCAKNIRESVAQLDGVESADLSYASKLLIVTPIHESSTLDESIQSKITRIGFGVKRQSDGWISSFRERLENEANHKIPWTQVSLVWFLAMWSSMLAFSGYIGGELSQNELYLLALLSSVLGLPAILIGVFPFAKAGIRALWFSHLLTLDLFISIGGFSAIGVSIISLLSRSNVTYADSGSMIVAILLLTKKIENTILTTATSNILYQLRSDQSSVEVFKKDVWTHADAPQIKKNSLVRFSPGETILFDGVLESNLAEINNHLMNGESDTMEVKKGDHIFAGAIAKSRFEMLVSAPLGQRKIDAWAESAIIGGNRQSHYSQALAKIESYLVIMAFLGAFIITLIRIFKGGSMASLIESFFVGILIFCPCLFASILPLAKQISRLALLKSGLLLHRDDALLDLTHSASFYFDKTGTLQAVESTFAPINSECNVVLPYLKSLSEKANHVILRGLSISAESKTLTSLVETAGLGVLAKAEDGTDICVGKASFLENHEIDISGFDPLYPLVSMNGKIVGQIINKNIYDSKAIQFLEKFLLFAPSSNVSILSGDPKQGAGDTLTQVSSRISYIGGLSPTEKMDRIDANAVFVGDGLNDTLALSKARVSFRLGHRISGFVPVDFELQSPNLNLILVAIQYAKKFRKVLLQTACAAALYNVAAIALASLGFFSPLGAVISMLFSFSIMLLSVFRLNTVQGIES